MTHGAFTFAGIEWSAMGLRSQLARRQVKYVTKLNSYMVAWHIVQERDGTVAFWGGHGVRGGVLYLPVAA